VPTEATTGPEHPCHISNSARHIGHNLERFVRHGQVEALVAKGQECPVGESKGAVSVLLTRVVKQCQRGVNAGYSVTSGVEIADDAALATADLDGQSLRRRDELIKKCSR
jgi:hypothetical protein